MSILKRGRSKFWYIQFQFQFQFKGKTYVRSSKTTDKKAAEQIEREMRRQLHAQEFLGQKERITVRESLERFCLSKKGTANHKNVLIHTRILNRVLRTNRNLDELTSEDLERLKRDRLQEGTTPATLKHTFTLIRGAWKYAKRIGYRVSHFEFPEIRTSGARLRYLSVDEERVVLKELDPKREGAGLRPYDERSTEMKRNQQDAYDIVVVLLDTGARYSEIAGLEWNQIDLRERTIRLWRPKVQNESMLYMTDRVFRVLYRRQIENQGRYVFSNKAGGSRGYASQAIRKAFRRAGLHDCTIHTLLHTHASRLVQNGMNLYEVKEILGHTDIKTTMRYAHLERRDVSSRVKGVINFLNNDLEKPSLEVVG